MPTSEQVVSPPDGEMLRRYLAGDAPAFADLVRRHAGFVYSVALRQTRDRHLAEDVAQAVFLLVVKKAPSLLDHADLCGWLFTATMFEARNVLKSRSREARRIERHGRETAVNRRDEAMPSSTWEDVEPHLDEALEALNDGERTAVMLRYLRRNSYEQVAAALGVTPAAARQRVHRALDHMRQSLARRGVAVASAAGLAADMRLNGVLPPPADLVANTIEAAGRLAAGGAAGGASAIAAASAKTKGIAAALILTTVGIAAVAVAIVARHRPTGQTMYVEPATGGVVITTAPPGAQQPARPPVAATVRPAFQQIRASSADGAQGTRTVGGFVGYINKDDYLRFDKVDLGPPGTSAFTAMVACPDQYVGNRIEVRADRLDGPVLATLTVKSTGGHGNWRPQSVKTAPHAGGVHDLFLRFSGGGWNFDTFTLVASTRPAVGSVNAVTFNEAAGVLHTRGGVVCETADGAWVRYAGLQFAPGVNAVAVTYSCDDAHAGGTLALRLDRPDAPPVATIDVKSTGNYRQYVTRVLPLEVAGTHDLILTFAGRTPGVANVSKLEFRSAPPAPVNSAASASSPMGK